MKKEDLIKSLAKDLKWSNAQTERVLDAFFSLIAEIMIKDKKLSLSKFGIFSVKHRVSRKGRNPRTGEELILPPRDYPHFKASKSIADAINE